MNGATLDLHGFRPPRNGGRGPRFISRRDKLRRPVRPDRLAAVILSFPPATQAPHRGRFAGSHKIRTALGLVAACIALLVWWARPGKAQVQEELFLLEALPPEAEHAHPDPAPPPPKPEPVPEENPPPQFGMREEALSEAGEMPVATGNTLMTEADSVAKAPVDALPAAPQLVDQAPRILKGRAPEYPARALDRGVEGTVVVLITIDTLGRVTRADIEKSGGREFDPDVIRSVRALVFQPPVRNGKRVPARFRQPYEFRLE